MTAMEPNRSSVTPQEMRDAVEQLRQQFVAKPRPKILIVEDNVFETDLLIRQVHKQCVPSDITTSRTCEQALKLIQETQFDLVFLDLLFPGKMSGSDLLKEVGDQTERIPFIAISNLDDAANEMQAALVHGARAIFSKRKLDDVTLRMICGLIT